jgi:hypothetical protein
MKNALRVITRISMLCVQFVEVSRQRRMLRAMQELGHPGVLHDINAAWGYSRHRLLQLELPSTARVTAP